MRQLVFNITGPDDCAVDKAMGHVLDSVTRRFSSGSCDQVAPAAQAISISLECWRDENGKLHCKLTVSLGSSI